MSHRVVFHGSGSSKQSELLTLIENVVNACISKRVEEQKKFAECLKGSLAGVADPSETILYHFSKKRSCNGGSLKNLIRAVEKCRDDPCLLLLCRFIQDLISIGSIKACQARHRKLIKADATSALIRALRYRLKETISQKKSAETKSGNGDITLAEQSEETLAALVLAVGARDCRLSLKIRVGGVLQLLCSLMASDYENPVSITKTQLLCRSVRSSRNAQLALRHRGFLAQLLVRISSMKGRDPIENAFLAHCLEVLYFVAKIRKARAFLIGENVVALVVPLLGHHFCWMKEDSCQHSSITSADIHVEICLISLALLKLLSSNKRAKEQLLSCDILNVCHRIMVDIDKKDLCGSSIVRLQVSLCSLCLCCLPKIRFPFFKSTFPFMFSLPNVTSPARCRSSSTSPEKHPETSRSSAAEQSAEIYVEDSSDDDGIDEDDDMFARLDEERGSLIDEMDNDATLFKEDVIAHSRLKISDLESYSSYFNEYEHGAEPKRCEDFVSYSESLHKNIQSTHSVIPFVKIAFPESQNPDVDLSRQPRCHSGTSVRDVLVREINRAQTSVQFPSRIVFDLDSIVIDAKECATPSSPLTCNDHTRVGFVNSKVNHLLFESRFESGNLRRATQVGPNYYELILSPDINQKKEHYQWFYFEVSNIVNDIVYTFEIINCLKATSMYSKGMQPVMYSVRDALAGQPGWVRAGESVCYYRNLYTTGDCCEVDDCTRRKRDFYSIRFNVTFQNKGDVCYFAYHFPYTLSYLKATISRCLSRICGGLYYSNDVIGKSLGGNPVHLLTVTAPCAKPDIARKDFIFVCSRVHPGESNASWIMHGILETLLMSSDPVVEELRRRFVFKIVPMLNPDGVVNGSHRCSLSGEDLNRVWDRPSHVIHPEIYHTKAIIQYMIDVLKRPPFVFVDLHGHSQRSNVFIFGNNPEESWRVDDKTLPHNYDFMRLPEVLEQISPAFSFNLCQFGITRGKESSARVTVWRQFGVTNAYTMESTFFGFETGAFKGYQISTNDLKDIGRELLLGILEVWKMSRHPKRQIKSQARKRFAVRRITIC